MSSLRLTLPATFAALALTACSFSMQAGKPKNANTPANTANNGQPASPAPATPAKPSRPRLVAGRGTLSKTPSPKLSRVKASDWLAKRKNGGSSSGGSSSGGSSSGGSTTPPNEPTFVTGTTPFGGPDGNDTSFVGLIYFSEPGATALPSFAVNPHGVMFVNSLAVPPNTTFAGFPGVANRKDDFALRYEAPLVVGTEAEYELRMVSDDGAKLYIDDMLILDNDGVKSAATEVKGPVHLVAATHSIRIDYFHTTGPVALQVFVKPPGSAETPLGTRL